MVPVDYRDTSFFASQLLTRIGNLPDHLQIAFLLLAVAVGWTYVFFPLGLRIRSYFFGTPLVAQGEGDELPPATVVLACRNEAAAVESRIANLLEQDYPAELLDVIVVCNACTDDTEEVARTCARTTGRVQVATSSPDEGKAGALNVGAGLARGEILIFADSRQRFAPDAVRRLAECFADPDLGAVSGRLVIGDAARGAARGMGTYWEYETALRIAESRTGSVIGATGAIYAIRRALFTPVPANLILDDVFVPMTIVLRGYEVGLQPDAVAYDVPVSRSGSEYRRKLRTMTGNLQLVRVLPDLLRPSKNPYFIRYVSHKLARVLSPVMIGLLMMLGFLLPFWPYGATSTTIAAFLGAGAVGLLVPLRPLAIPSAFVLALWAALVALVRPGRDASIVWGSSARETDEAIAAK